MIVLFIIKSRHQSVFGVNGRLNPKSFMQLSETSVVELTETHLIHYLPFRNLE